MASCLGAKVLGENPRFFFQSWPSRGKFRSYEDGSEANGSHHDEGSELRHDEEGQMAQVNKPETETKL